MQEGIRVFMEAGLSRRLTGDLARTPARVARAWKDDLLAGYREDPAEILSPLPAGEARDLVAVTGIDFVSTCAHHLLPFHGKVHVAYLPDGRITGISRIGSLVACLSRRLQIQEALTREIVEAIRESLRPLGAACRIEAVHLCMSARGHRSSPGAVVTIALAGCFESDRRLRAEALAVLGTAGGERSSGKRRRSGRERR
jgi:GTP cyclohydrolase I